MTTRTAFVRCSFSALMLAVVILPSLGQPGKAASGSRTLLLKDSVRVRGTVVTKNDSVLILDSGYGLLKIPASEILDMNANHAGQAEAGEASVYPTMRGTKLFSGTIGFSSASADGSSRSLTTFTLAPDFIHFAADGFGVGATILLDLQSEGGNSSTSVGVGPQFMVVLSKPTAQTKPYIKVGYMFLSQDVTSHVYYSYSTGYSTISSHVTGGSFSFSLGILATVGNHLAIPIEARVDASTSNGRSYTQFGVGVGLAGLFY